MSQSVAHHQLRAFVERILRMKEEARAINDAIKEIYAEAKGNGFDKTALGKVVNHVEKRAKSPETLAEQEALFDLYLSAYDGHEPSHTHAHAREDVPDHDPETGEIKERHGGEKPVEPSSQQAANGGGDDADGASESGAPIHEPQPPGVGDNAPTAAQTAQDAQPALIIAAEVDAVETSAPIQPETANDCLQPPETDRRLSAAGPKDTAGRQSADPLRAERGRPGDGVTAGETAPHSEPAEPAGAPAGKSVEPSGSAAPSNVTGIRKKWRFEDKAHADCLNAAQCGGFSNLGLCTKCKEAIASDRLEVSA